MCYQSFDRVPWYVECFPGQPITMATHTVDRLSDSRIKTLGSQVAAVLTKIHTGDVAVSSLLGKELPGLDVPFGAVERSQLRPRVWQHQELLALVRAINTVMR
jgi:hypothetical protein